MSMSRWWFWCLALMSVLAWRSSAFAARRAPDDAGAVALSARPDVVRFALVVGSNDTLDPAQSPLRFADDDAARVTELLLQAGVDVELATSLDRESQGLFPDLVDAGMPPTEAELERAWKRLSSRMQAAKDGGSVVELLFYYSGHGDVGPDGQGYLTLQAGKLTRRELFAELLSTSVADYNHIVIDACRSEQFVLSRGRKTWKDDRVDADASRQVQQYLDKTHLGAFPNTGVILAHSADQQTHEWERYRGGIFTHELLSGLRGAADLNGDGRIEYSELGAFVSAANSAVADPRARLEVVVRPPHRDERRPVLVHEDVAAQRVLLFSGHDPGLYTVEDVRGLRVADMHRAGDTPGYVRLPPGPLFVQRESPSSDDLRPLESEIPADMDGVIRVAQLDFHPSRRTARGALDQAFREGLFAVPYGRGYYAGYTDQRGLLPVREPTWHVRIWKEVDGQTVEDHEVTIAPEPGQAPEAVTVTVDDDAVTVETDDEPVIDPHAKTWGGIFLGTIITPLNPSGRILASRRVTSNEFRGCLAPLESTSSGCSPVRGFDLRWQIFRTSSRRKYPSLLGYFRTGYTAGHAEFVSDGMRIAGEAERLSYLSVPLFLGGNIYAFDRFPLRPYAGMGFGLDVLRVDYDRHVPDMIVDPGIDPTLSDVSARIGFELHAGLELRIRNVVTLSAEVMQLWSKRRNLNGVPDFSNEGFTVILGLSYAFELVEGSPGQTKTVVRKRKAEPAPP